MKAHGRKFDKEWQKYIDFTVYYSLPELLFENKQIYLSKLQNSAKTEYVSYFATIWNRHNQNQTPAIKNKFENNLEYKCLDSIKHQDNMSV